jgi:hypothetical protein
MKIDLPPLWVKRRNTRCELFSALAPILLQKSFRDEERNFSGPLMRFARGDMRDHIDSPKIDHELA